MSFKAARVAAFDSVLASMGVDAVITQDGVESNIRVIVHEDVELETNDAVSAGNIVLSMRSDVGAKYGDTIVTVATEHEPSITYDVQREFENRGVKARVLVTK